MNGLLLDTSILLWHAASDQKLSAIAKGRIRGEAGPVLISIASAWEIAIKVGIGKLSLDTPIGALLGSKMAEDGIEILPISTEDIEAYASLHFPTPNHRDPFDRMLIVQASTRGLTLLTSDPALTAYGNFVELV